MGKSKKGSKAADADAASSVAPDVDGRESVKSVDLGEDVPSPLVATLLEDVAITDHPSSGVVPPPEIKPGFLGSMSQAIGGLFKQVKRQTEKVLPVAGPSLESIMSSSASTICANLEGQGPCIDSRVQDLVWGWPVNTQVDKTTISYFRVNIQAKHIENGFVVYGSSSAWASSFRMMLFNDKGEKVFSEESVKTSDGNETCATVFFTKFDTYSLKKTAGTAVEASASASLPAQVSELAPSLFAPTVPSLFQKLDNLAVTKARLVPPGQYLLCVGGQNMLPGKTDVRILVVPSVNDGPDLLKLQNSDISLVHLKDSLHQLRSEYLSAKEAFESVLSRMNEQERALYVKLQARDDAYKAFLSASALAFTPEGYSVPRQRETSLEEDDDATASASASAAAAGPSLLEKLSVSDKAPRKPSDPQQVGLVMAGTPVEVVTSTAAHAGGWIASKVSAGIGSLQQLVKSATASPPPLSPFPAVADGSAAGGSGNVLVDEELASDPELEPVFSEVASAKHKLEKKKKALKKALKQGAELADRRAAQVEADKARFVKEASLATESFLESFALDSEARAKEEGQARQFAESLLKQRIAAFEEKAREETNALMAEQGERERQAEADKALAATALAESCAKKDAEVARVTAVREAERKQREEDEAKALVERIDKEAHDVDAKQKTEDEENVKKQELAREWQDKLERERVATAEQAARDLERLEQEKAEAAKLQAKLSEERRAAEEKAARENAAREQAAAEAAAKEAAAKEAAAREASEAVAKESTEAAVAEEVSGKE